MKRPWVAAVSAALLVLGYWMFGVAYLDGFRLDLGSGRIPTPTYFLMATLLVWLGLPAVALSTWAVSQWLGAASRLERLRAYWLSVPDRTSILLAGAFGTLIPLAIQAAVLGHAPLTDDEPAYRFSAELLASGRLWAPSPPLKLFFDNSFLVNDGRMYGQYFLGWPFLLAFGTKVGMPWLVNPVLSGATAVAIFLVGRTWWGSAWGRVAVVLYLGSPFLMTGAATMMSHTATVFAFTWALVFLNRVDSGKARAWNSGALAFAICLAFWTRPAVAVGLGVPLIAAWGLSLWRQPRRSMAGHLLAFGLVAGALGALFLATNQALNGSPWMTGYHAIARYWSTNAGRFTTYTTVSKTSVEVAGFFHFFHERSVVAILGKFVTAFVRLSVDGFGWPMGLGLVVFAKGRWARWMAAAILGFAVTHIPVADVGIDSFGPVHFTEVMLPVVLLSTAGLKTLWNWSPTVGAPAFAPALLVSLLVVAATTFTPTRWQTLSRMASDINAPIEAVEAQAPDGAIVFTLRPFARFCRGKPAKHFVLSRPNNDPDLTRPVLWANHVSIERDWQLVRSMPGRAGFLLVANAACEYRLIPLEQATPAQFPASVAELPTDFPPLATP